ncbi:MAG: methyltransferase, partial [Acetobacteraceae bacterium]|nr:methyltransferase [Acetobacteraceae bacterium]
MTRTSHHPSQLTLSLFDTTAISGLTLDGGTVEVPAPTHSDLSLADEPDEAASPAAAAPAIPACNWRLAGQRALAPTWKGRAADNLAAIRLAHAIEAEGRHATPAEQEQLSRFVAFGASELANACFRRTGEAFRPGWEEIGTALEQEVSATEIAGLMRATQYAHYTPEFIVRSIWQALTRMGLAGGRVLEPGCGSGLFMAMLPEAAAGRTALTGIEADPVTARIAKLLFPQAWIRAEDFTKAKLAERYDVVVGNPPFSDRSVRADDPAGRLGLSLHDYFIARSVERLRPGGVAVFVSSRWTLDKAAQTARGHIASMADLVGAVRLPAGAMRAEAGTDIVVDVLVLRRRLPGEAGNGIGWSDLAEVVPPMDGEHALLANRYFAEHPEMVLGTHAWTTGPYGPAYTCEPSPGACPPLAERLDAALALIAVGVRLPAPEQATTARETAPRIVVSTAAEGATVKEGSYVLLGGALMQVVDGVPVAVAVKSATCKEGIF